MEIVTSLLKKSGIVDCFLKVVMMLGNSKKDALEFVGGVFVLGVAALTKTSLRF